MRKDLVLGLSIGGVLLLVVVAYLAWHPHGTTHGPLADAGDPSADVAPPGPATAPSGLTKPADTLHPAVPVADNTNYFLHTLYHGTSTPLQAYQSGSDRVGAPAPATLPAPTGLSPALTPRHSPQPELAPIAPPPSGVTSGSVVTPAVASAAVHTRVVKNGDTPSSIAAEVYGSANYYPYILRANPNLDPHHMKIGMVINLPDTSTIHPEGSSVASAGAAAAAVAEHAPAAIDPKTQYVVESGDSLYKISLKLYHNSLMMDAIYAANKEEIGPDMAVLKLHQVLKLPKPLAAAPTTQS